MSEKMYHYCMFFSTGMVGNIYYLKKKISIYKKEKMKGWMEMKIYYKQKSDPTQPPPPKKKMTNMIF